MTYPSRHLLCSIPPVHWVHTVVARFVPAFDCSAFSSAPQVLPHIKCISPQRRYFTATSVSQGTHQWERFLGPRIPQYTGIDTVRRLDSPPPPPPKQGILVDEYLKRHPEPSRDRQGHLYCTQCHIQLALDTTWIEHIRSVQHTFNTEKHRMEAEQEDGCAPLPAGEPPLRREHLWCGACREQVPFRRWQKHVSSRQHVEASATHRRKVFQEKARTGQLNSGCVPGVKRAVGRSMPKRLKLD